MRKWMRMIAVLALMTLALHAVGAAEEAQKWPLPGIVRASGTVNLRGGPSTTYEVIGFLKPDDCVTIFSETKEGWYVVDTEYGQTGYVSGKLIAVVDENLGRHDSWQEAYIGNVQTLGEDARYALIDLDGDDIPELAAYSETANHAYRIIACADGFAHVLVSSDPLRYVEGGNRILKMSGRMDMYQDDVFALTGQGFSTVAEGEYSGYKDGWSEELGRYICKNYVWNGEAMSMEAYMDALDAVIDLEKAKEPEYAHGYDEILALLGQ